MRTKSPLIVAILIVVALAVTSQPAEAQGRRSHGGVHLGAHIAVGLAIGGLLGVFFDQWGPEWEAQWYPPYGYPPRGPYPPYRYRLGDTSAEVRVQVEPSSAEVYVDGYLAGNVSDFDGYFQRLHLSPGAHEIVVYEEGFRSLVRRMHFAPGASLRIRENLELLGPGEPFEPRPIPADDPRGLRDAPPEPGAPPPMRDELPQRQRSRRTAAADVSLGEVSVRVQPLDADVVVDGELWQRAEGLDRLVVSLPVGPHRVDVRKPGFVPFTKDVTVEAGETVSLNVSLSERK